MTSREKTDLEDAEKYAGRWIIGRDLIFPNRFGADITPSGSFEALEETPEMQMFIKIIPSTGKQKPEDMYSMDAGRMSMQPTAVYLGLKTAKILQGKLEKLRELHSSTIGKIILYDADENESLLAACVLSREVLPRKLVELKWEINGIGQPYNAKVLTYEWNEDGKWVSVDWNPGLMYKKRVI